MNLFDIFRRHKADAEDQGNDFTETMPKEKPAEAGGEKNAPDN